MAGYHNLLSISMKIIYQSIGQLDASSVRTSIIYQIEWMVGIRDGLNGDVLRVDYNARQSKLKTISSPYNVNTIRITQTSQHQNKGEFKRRF